MGAVLRQALLWACMDPVIADLVATDIQREVTAEFIKLESNLKDGTPLKS